MDYAYIDLETIPAQSPDVMAEIREGLQSKLAADIEAIRAPGNYKNPDLIAAWMSNEGQEKAKSLRIAFDEEVDSTYRKTSLDGAFGQIAVIGFAFDNGPPQSIWSDNWQNPGIERELLADFSEVLASSIPPSREQSICVVGHNVTGFDLRFLMQRHIVNGIRPHRVISAAAQAKPWELNRVYDTMIQWAGTGGRIKLDKLCKALSVPSPKGGIDGSMVWDFVRDGKIESVAEYCKRDVVATRTVHRAMNFMAPVVELKDVLF